MLLEMQTIGANGNYAPAEYSPAVWQVVKAATDAGIIVVAAAGNGNENLDAPGYASYRALAIAARSSSEPRVTLGAR